MYRLVHILPTRVELCNAVTRQIRSSLIRHISLKFLVIRRAAQSDTGSDTARSDTRFNVPLCLPLDLIRYCARRRGRPAAPTLDPSAADRGQEFLLDTWMNLRPRLAP